MQRVGLREQSTIAFLLTFDLLWGVVAYLLAFVARIYLPFPFTADFLPATRVFELHHMLPQILLMELVILYFFGFYDLRALRSSFRAIVNSVTALFVHMLATAAPRRRGGRGGGRAERRAPAAGPRRQPALARHDRGSTEAPRRARCRR